MLLGVWNRACGSCFPFLVYGVLSGPVLDIGTGQLPQARFHTPSNSTVRFRTGSSDKVYEKSIGSRFDKVSDDDIEKIIAEQKKTEIQRMRLTNGLKFSRTSVSPTATSVS